MLEIPVRPCVSVWSKAYSPKTTDKKNQERFPEDFMFQLTAEEVKIMVSQNVIPSMQSLGGYLPYAFCGYAF